MAPSYTDTERICTFLRLDVIVYTVCSGLYQNTVRRLTIHLQFD